MHPLLSQQKLLRMARENNIQVMAFSNFGSSSYVELGMTTPEESLMLLPQITEIAQRYSKSAAQVLLRWAVQRGTTAIPKSVKTERLVENMTVFDFNLSQAEVAVINGLN